MSFRYLELSDYFGAEVQFNKCETAFDYFSVPSGVELIWATEPPDFNVAANSKNLYFHDFSFILSMHFY